MGFRRQQPPWIIPHFFPLILNLLLSAHPELVEGWQRRQEKQDRPEWRQAILQQVQDERKKVIGLPGAAIISSNKPLKTNLKIDAVTLMTNRSGCVILLLSGQ